MSDGKVILRAGGDGGTRKDGNNHGPAKDTLVVRHTCDAEDVAGETRFFDTLHLPLKNEMGDIIGTLGISRDVTKDKKAQETLMMNEEFFRTVFEENPLGMAALDSDLQLIKINKSFYRIFGYEEGDASLNTLTDVISPSSASDFTQKIKEVLEGKTSQYRADIRYIGKNGEPSQKSTSINAIGNNGRGSSVLLVLSEVPAYTEQSKDAPLHPPIHRAQMMELLGTLASGVAQDFSNVLTTVIGFSSLMQEKMDKDDPGQAYLTKILTSSKKAAGLTRSLLTFGRNQPIDLKPSKINNIIRDSAKLLKQFLSDGVELRAVLTDENPTVMADAAQINHMLIVFASNACEAMPDGGTFSIETRIVDIDNDFTGKYGFGEPGTYVLVRVADDGIGMDEETQKRIFEPFFTTKGTGQNTGLGLAAAYRIAKGHDGYVTVSSAPGRGTAFSVYLPLVNIQIEQKPYSLRNGEDANRAEARELLRKREGTGKVVTILIAEDNQTVRGLIISTLQEYGYFVIETTNRQETVRVFKENRNWVDLVILGETIPVRTRLQIYKEIENVRPKTNTIFIGGTPDELDFDINLTNGACRFVPKPLVLEDFLMKIREMLENTIEEKRQEPA